MMPSSTAMTIADDGNVGIGTTSPSNEWNVEGRIAVAYALMVPDKTAGSVNILRQQDVRDFGGQGRNRHLISYWKTNYHRFRTRHDSPEQDCGQRRIRDGNHRESRERCIHNCRT